MIARHHRTLVRGMDAVLAVCVLAEVGLIDFASGIRWGLWLDGEAAYPVSLWTRRVR